MCNHTAWFKCLYERVTPYSCHPWWAVDCMLLVSSFCLSPCFSPLSLSFLPHSTCTLICTPSMWTASRETSAAPWPNEEYCHWRYTILPQVMSPSSLTTSTTQRLLKWSSRKNPATKIRSPRTCVTRNSTMRPSGKRYLFQCSFRNEENQRTEDNLITLVKKVCCQLSSFSHTQERRDPCTKLVEANKNQVVKWKMKESGFFLLERPKKANSRWRENRDSEKRISSRFWWKKYSRIEWNYRVSAKRNWSYSCRWWTTSTRWTTSSSTIFRTKSGSSWSSYEKSYWGGRIESSSRVHIRSISRRILIEDRDTILQLTAKIQELQKEINCVNDLRDFQDAESVRSGQSHVTSQPVLLPLFRNPDGMLSRSVGMLSRTDKSTDSWDTHGISGNVFVNPPASSSSL